MKSHIQLNLDNSLAEIRLNRPERANALTDMMLIDLIAAIEQAANANVLTITGAGSVFSAGADLDHLPDGLATSPNWELLSKAIADFPGLTIAKINGTVAGGAMGMVLACDLRIAVTGTKFFYPALAKGVDPQPSDANRCVNLIGPARTAEIFLACRKVSAETALEWGLVNEVVSVDGLDEEIKSASKFALQADQGAISRIKTQIYS